MYQPLDVLLAIHVIHVARVVHVGMMLAIRIVVGIKEHLHTSQP